MNTDVKNLNGETIKQIPLPSQFDETYEPILITRAINAIRSRQRQPTGSLYYAGIQGVSAKLSRRRRNYKGSYGHGISRAPRKTVWRRGMQFGWIGALAPGTRGGRRAHPPKPEANWNQKINKQEKTKATRSALAALVHHKTLLIVESKIETITKTQELHAILTKLGFHVELARTSVRKIRAGSGKRRGRKYKTKQGPLLIIANKAPVEKAAHNIPGLTTAQVRNINPLVLTHGDTPRLTIWSEDALHKLEKEHLFTR